MNEVKETVTETKETAAELVADSLKTKETVAETKETVRKRGRPKGSKDKKPRKAGGGGGKVSPVTGNGMNGIETNPGDNAKYMALNMKLFTLPNLNIYSATIEEVDERLETFFEIYYNADVKPTVAGMAMALGINRANLLNIVNDRPVDGLGYTSTLRSDVAQEIKKAYKIMENFWEIYMNSGKINPVTGIFLAKNNFGYVDKQETVLTPNTKQDNDYSMDEIKERYRLSEPAATELLEDKES